MSNDLFDIYFSGRLIPDNDPDEVKQKIGVLFKANAQTLEQLFSGKPIKIKKAVDMDTAIKYRVKFRDIGAIVDIRPYQQSTQQPPAPPTESTIPSPSQKSQNQALAAVGSIIDDAPKTPSVEIDTHNLKLGPIQGDSLEEFAEKVIPAKIPDISNLNLVQSSDPLDTSPQAAPAEINISDLSIAAIDAPLDSSPTPETAHIDISNLSLSFPNSGSLEEFNHRPDPKPIPDTKDLSLI